MVPRICLRAENNHGDHRPRRNHVTNQNCQSINLRTKKIIIPKSFCCFQAINSVIGTITASVGILSLGCNFVRNCLNKCRFVRRIGLFFSVYDKMSFNVMITDSYSYKKILTSWFLCHGVDTWNSVHTNCFCRVLV